MREIGAVALNTFRESMRSKVLYSLIIFALFVCIGTSLFGRVTIGEQSLVVLTFGLFCSSFFSATYVIISGASLFSKEINKRTIITLLAKPIPRYSILIGKWLGLTAAATILCLGMGTALALYTNLVFGTRPLIVFESCFFYLLELMVVSALIIFFSSIVVTPLLVGLFSFGILLAGRSASYITQFINSLPSSITKSTFKLLNGAIPKFEYLTMADRIVAGESLSFESYSYAFSYSLGYSILMLCIASFIFNRREFH